MLGEDAEEGLDHVRVEVLAGAAAELVDCLVQAEEPQVRAPISGSGCGSDARELSQIMGGWQGSGVLGSVSGHNRQRPQIPDSG